MNPPKPPKVGDIVHYYISEEPRAALVTGAGEDGDVSLVIFYPSSISFTSYSQYSETKELGTWCFPEFSGDKTPEVVIATPTLPV